MEPERNPRLHVVVLTYRDGGECVELLEVLAAEGIAPRQVTVVQNAATTADRFSPADPQVRVISSEINLGYAAGMNVGISESLRLGSEQILLLTHDVRPHKGCVAALSRCMSVHPALGVVGPVIESDEEHRGHRAAGGFLDAAGRTGHHAADAAPATGVWPVDWVDGAIMLFRAAVFSDAGLLDARFFMYCDEIEMCLRARRSGWQVGVCVEATARQKSGKSRRPGAFNYLQTRNGLELARLARGRRAAGVIVVGLLPYCWQLLRVSFGPRSLPTERDAARVRLSAIARGIFHFLGRRFGPPPPGLRGLGDVQVAAPAVAGSHD